ncbi:MAG TPA: ABC transporter permease, partial [Vicinamibacteria bacterium]|nr:ABC transporter permease [Vicinamibacteria bacterium]
KPLRVAVLDASGALGGPVEAALARRAHGGLPRFIVEPSGEGPLGLRERALREAVLSGRLDGYLRLPPDALREPTADYFGKIVSNVIDLRMMEDAVSDTLVGLRLAGAGLEPERVRDLTRKLDLRTIRLTAGGEREDRGASAIFSIVLMMMLYTTVLMWGQAVLTGVIEEKSNRVVEVIVSAIPSVMLLAGKLLGVGAAGLTQFLVWALCLAAVSVAGAGLAAAGGARLPEVTPFLLASFVLYFLLGYLLYSALFAAVGASVNTTQEAQSLAFPIFMPLVVGVMFFPMVLQSPDSPLSTVLSLVPLLTPLLMFLRITVLTPPPWQIALSIALTGATIVAVLWAAARIYRVGILMYGKRPTLAEILRWVARS